MLYSKTRLNGWTFDALEHARVAERDVRLERDPPPEPPSGDPAIELRGISKSFAVRGANVAALRDVTLTVERGDVFGIAGRSGAGKSTLLRCINLLERPDGGSVTVAGQRLSALPPPALRAARTRIGMIFQHFNLLSSRTVAQNVALPLELAGMPRGAIRDAVEPLLEFVGLDGLENRYPAQLSGGQKQRVGIARALANRPDVLLCDEPTSALDPRTTRTILDLLRGVNERFGVTIVLVTHHVDTIRALCRHVAVMDAGRIAEIGPVVPVFAAPATAATRALVSRGDEDDDGFAGR